MTAPDTTEDRQRMQGTLSVVRPASPVEAVKFETFIKITADGSVTAYNGHVDLGTGIRTALGQIVAEELDVSFARVVVVLGDTSLVPNQGATIASETIQITAVPLRKAAAQARQFLIVRAAARLELPVEELVIEDGLIRGRDNRSVSYGELIAGETIQLELADDVPVKSADAYTIVGQSVPRIDLPAKATGELVYVHDMRVPGMLHGRVVRPPYAGVDVGDFIGNSLIAVDEASVRDIPGLVAVVRIGDFVGVVAEREENAIKAAAQLKVTWKPVPTLPDLKDIETALRANPSTPRTLIDKGNVDAAIAGAAKPMPRTYIWPYQMHASIGPSCAVADYQEDLTRVWSGTQNPHHLRTELARLIHRREAEIEVIRMEAAGCYGRNCADDVSADAVLLSRAVGRPVRVQLTREQEHAWEPKGTAQLMDVNGGLNADGSVAGYDFATRYPSNGAPTLALLLTGAIPHTPVVFEMGDRTAIPPYDYDNLRVVANDSQGGLAEFEWEVTVVDVPHPPAVSISAPMEGNRGYHVGVPLTFFASAFDPDGDVLSYEWKDSGGQVLLTTANGTFVFRDPGTQKITLKVSDGVLSVTTSVNVTVDPAVNGKPFVPGFEGPTLIGALAIAAAAAVLGRRRRSA